MINKTFVVRKVNLETIKRFRAKAANRDIKLGKALSEAMEKWVNESHGEIGPENILKLEGIIKGKKPVRWSEEVDEVLYGWKK